MNMDMDMDQVVEIPDTPDRLTTRHGDRKYVANPDVDITSMTKSDRGFPGADEINNGNNYITVSSSEKSRPSQNAPMFRRVQIQKIFGPGTTRSNNVPEKMDKGKTVSSNSPSKSSQHGSVSVLHLSEDNGRSQQLKSTFSNHGSRNSATEDKKELKANFGNSSLPFTADSSNASRNAYRGKCNKPLSGLNTSVDRGKSIALSSDSQCPQKIEKQVSLHPLLSSSPRVRGQKRLVRNGCISPHNIAIRAKQTTEQNSHQSIDIEQSHAGHSVSSNTMSPISVDDIVAEERGNVRVKGKGVLIHPSSHEINAGTIHTATRPVINCEEVGGTSDATRNSIKYSEGQSGWRTTHSDVGRSISGQNRNIMDRRDIGGCQSSNGVTGSLLDHAAQATSLTILEANQLPGIHSTTDALTKRQRKRGSASGSHNEPCYNSEIMFLGSSGESSSSPRSPVLSSEVIELLSEPRYTNRISIDLDDDDNNSSDARVQQVEADEILARELQEQLYHDDSFEGRGIDEHLAWEMQNFGDLLHTSIDSHNIPHSMRLPREPSNRQPRPSTRQNPSNRRAMPQVPFSNRTSQLRNRTIRRSLTPRISTRGRRPQFPLDMDLDMRLDILEALEDAVGGLSDMGMADDIFHAGRDFNEDDYEMLLALDEGNHRHTGASSNQINGLPQSTIQTENCTEVCAVCLETPVKGETIRHLPCLHKFHKDCIDPWLRRKPSCPVCKSSII
ncbi:putative transcription factor C2H2 family [Lupinus albus]|uniref:Putative transcription factor C2H2 family n=1 Tax=Lupinus albus TaxID=3870 RepID=A0A6A4QVH5_LUPAL|nr:putative transcription factor C2H2 family [Lupinus albus]